MDKEKISKLAEYILALEDKVKRINQRTKIHTLDIQKLRKEITEFKQITNKS